MERYLNKKPKTQQQEASVYVLGEGAQLELYPWPDDLEIPSIEDVLKLVSDKEYVEVKVQGKGLVNQPRKTLCYGHSYNYSGQKHPVEKETPEYIEKLYAYTNKKFNVNLNMCLLNVYPTGYHSISSHSDSVKQMGVLSDVYCWVVCDTPRKAIFRNKKDTTAKKFEIYIPQGLYIMRGPNFQRDFTHEFPKVQNTYFEKTLLPLCNTQQTKLEKADWIYNNREELKLILKDKRFNEFISPRISWTLRQFK